jgi:hypothetical protein
VSSHTVQGFVSRVTMRTAQAIYLLKQLALGMVWDYIRNTPDVFPPLWPLLLVAGIYLSIFMIGRVLQKRRTKAMN